MTFADALKKAAAWLDQFEGVEGVAEGRVDDEVCITVFVSVPDQAGQIPASFHGYKVVVESTEPFQARL